MMSQYGINRQHFLVDWSCGQQEPMIPEGIFSPNEPLNIKYILEFAYAAFIHVAKAKKNSKVRVKTKENERE